MKFMSLCIYEIVKKQGERSCAASSYMGLSSAALPRGSTSDGQILKFCLHLQPYNPTAKRCHHCTERLEVVFFGTKTFWGSVSDALNGPISIKILNTQSKIQQCWHYAYHYIMHAHILSWTQRIEISVILCHSDSGFIQSDQISSRSKAQNSTICHL